MAKEKNVYTNPEAGQPLITVISSGCKTPLLKVKFCCIVNAYYYPNSPTVPRYSITCLCDPKEHKDFLKGIETIETNEHVETILKADTKKEKEEIVKTGKVLVKFQNKEKIPVYNENGELIELEDELAKNAPVIVHYDILRYTKKNTLKVQHGISFKPTSVYYYPKGV